MKALRPPPAVWQKIADVDSSGSSGSVSPRRAPAVQAHVQRPERGAETRFVRGTQRTPVQLVRADRIKAGARPARDAPPRPPLSEPLAFSRPLADAAQHGIQRQEQVSRPRQRREGLELARPLALAAEGAAVHTIHPENPHLIVAAIGHVDFAVRPQRHAGHATELVRRAGVGQCLRPDRDHRSEARRWRGAGVGDVDDAVDGVEGGGQVAGCRLVIRGASGGEGQG